MTTDDIIKLAREIEGQRIATHNVIFSEDQAVAFFHAAQAIEREACAKVCAELGSNFKGHSSKRPWSGDFAYAIRNRGAKT